MTEKLLSLERPWELAKCTGRLTLRRRRRSSGRSACAQTTYGGQHSGLIHSLCADMGVPSGPGLTMVTFSLFFTTIHAAQTNMHAAQIAFQSRDRQRRTRWDICPSAHDDGVLGVATWPRSMGAECPPSAHDETLDGIDDDVLGVATSPKSMGSECLPSAHEETLDSIDDGVLGVGTWPKSM